MIMSLNHSNLRIFLIDIDLRLILFQGVGFKGSPEPSKFNSEINVGKSRIRHSTTLKLNCEFLDRVQMERR